MYNKIILIGMIADKPEVMYDTAANECLRFYLKVPLPPDAQWTYWGGVYDLRTSDGPVGDDKFLIICQDHILIEKCLSSLKKGDIVCVEGRLVLTIARLSNLDELPLAEILAHDIVAITEIPKISSQGA